MNTPALARALVVDDGPMNRRLLSHALSRDGIASDEAADAEEALRALRRTRYDVVLLDVALEDDEDGYAVLRAIRERPELDTLPVILVTGTAVGPEQVARGLIAGAQDHVAKPFDPLVLRARVTAVRRSRSAMLALQSSTAIHAREAEARREELGDVRAIQLAAMPSVPLVRGGLRVTGEVLPAGQVSGDAFDVVEDARGRVSVVLLDASGHGAAAGMVASVARQAARRALLACESLRGVVAAVEEALVALGGVLHAAVATAIVRVCPAMHAAEILNAGLPPLLCLRAGVQVPVAFVSSGLPLGLTPTPPCPKTTRAAPGDVWALVSDGLTGGELDVDAVAVVAERIGMVRSRGALLHADPPALRALMGETLAALGGAPHDDASLVLFGVEEPPTQRPA